MLGVFIQKTSSMSEVCFAAYSFMGDPNEGLPFFTKALMGGASSVSSFVIGAGGGGTTTGFSMSGVS